MFVNHLFAVVDRETCEAAERSTLLRAQADFMVTTVSTAGGEHWTGRYLTMRNTYIELFVPDEQVALGSIGLAFSGDTPGMLDRVSAVLEQAGVVLDKGMRRRAFGADQVDWFRMATVAAPPGPSAVGVDAWLMEYVPTYFAHPSAKKRPGTGPDDETSRLRYNNGMYTSKPFEDLVAADFGIDRHQYMTRVAPLLAAAGFRLRDLADGVEASDDEATLTFRFGTPPGLRSLRFRLSDAADTVSTETIGRSTLVVGPRREAYWTFVDG